MLHAKSRNFSSLRSGPLEPSSVRLEQLLYASLDVGYHDTQELSNVYEEMAKKNTRRRDRGTTDADCSLNSDQLVPCCHAIPSENRRV
jgi:hypothetical protein